MKMPDPSSAVFKKANQVLEFSMGGTELQTQLHPATNTSDVPAPWTWCRSSLPAQKWWCWSQRKGQAVGRLLH